jgi:hypothetical protein
VSATTGLKPAAPAGTAPQVLFDDDGLVALLPLLLLLPQAVRPTAIATAVPMIPSLRASNKASVAVGERSRR